MNENELNEAGKLVGNNKINIFKSLCDEINAVYDMEKIFSNGGKKWDFEYKFRKSGKTLCAFYFKKDILGFMIIFGSEEREKVESVRPELTAKTLDFYDKATTYHDGKWVMFELDDIEQKHDLMKLLNIKRKPNKK